MSPYDGSIRAHCMRLAPSAPLPADAIVAAITRQALAEGFSKVGFARVDQPPDLAGVETWQAAGYQADLSWMANPKRRDPALVLPGARSLICLALNYYHPTAHSQDPSVAKISRYAWGRDYHKVLGKRLKALVAWLQTTYGGEYRWYVDTGPIAEKPWAQQAGLGWLGKHSLLISREFGSWLFLGVIVTSLDLPANTPHTAHCGTCSRCLDACPTGAIVAPGVVDARRCIAYHTLESHAEALPPEIASQQQNWVAGCDICQDVCPWNQRFAQPTTLPDFAPYPGNISPKVADLAQMSEVAFEQQFPASALRRLKVRRLRRNAQAILAQQAALIDRNLGD